MVRTLSVSSLIMSGMRLNLLVMYLDLEVPMAPTNAILQNEPMTSILGGKLSGANVHGELQAPSVMERCRSNLDQEKGQRSNIEQGMARLAATRAGYGLLNPQLQNKCSATDCPTARVSSILHH